MKHQSYTAIRHTTRPYTLVELLVVLGISAILLGIGLPAFQKLATGQGTTLAARNISAKLKATRSYAIAKHEKIALLFPTGSELKERYRYASYRTCVVTTGRNKKYTFKDWVENEKWNFLPTGTVFFDIDDTSGFNNPNTPNHALAKIEDVDCKDIKLSGTDTKDLHGIVFYPSGRVDDNYYILIEQGKFTNGNIIRTNTNSNGLEITLNKYTGRISFDTK